MTFGLVSPRSGRGLVDSGTAARCSTLPGRKRASQNQNRLVLGPGCGFPDRCSRVFFGCRVVDIPRAAMMFLNESHRPSLSLYGFALSGKAFARVRVVHVLYAPESSWCSDATASCRLTRVRPAAMVVRSARRSRGWPFPGAISCRGSPGGGGGCGDGGFDASCVDEWLEVEKWEGLTSADSSTTPPVQPQARRTRPSGLVENAVVAIRCHPDRRGRTRAPPP